MNIAENYPEMHCVLATRRLADEVARNMRREDRDECRAFGSSPLEDILHGMENDAVTVVVKWLDAPMFVWGWRRTPEGRFLWGLSTHECDRHPRAVLEAGRTVAAFLRNEGDDWYGFVADKYARSIRWLEAIGFKAGEPFITDEGAIVRKFTLGR